MTSKTARTITGDKIKSEGEIIIPVSLNGITKKLSLRTCCVCVMSSGAFVEWK